MRTKNRSRSRGDSIRGRLALWFTCKRGKARGRDARAKAHAQARNGEKVDNVADLSSAVELTQLPQQARRRLANYLEDTNQRGVEAWKSIEAAPDRVRQIKDREKDYDQEELRAGLVHLHNPWLFAGEMLFVAALEAALTVPALSAIREYAVWAQWVVAIMVGLLLVTIVFFCGKAIAYLIKYPHHLHENRYRKRWQVMLVGAIVGVFFILSVPVFLTYSREYNESVINAAGREAQTNQQLQAATR